MSKKYNAVSTKGISRKQVKWRVIGAVALLALCLVVVFPSYANSGIDWVNNKANLGLPRLPSSGFNLGLDLQGGAHLIYRANTDRIPTGDQASAVDGVRDVIEKRVRGGLGVAEPLVQTTRVGEEYRIIVELPGVTDVNTAIKMIGDTPILEFKEQNNDPQRDLTKEETKQLNDFNATASKKATAALKEARVSKDFGAVAAKYSEDLESKNNGGNIGFVTADFYPEIYNWAKTHKVGEVSKELVKSFDGLNVVKKLNEKDGAKKVTASHILVCYTGVEGCTSNLSKEDAKKKIDEIKNEVTVKNFAELAKKYSTDPGSKDAGGDLGTFAKESMIAKFSDVAFQIPVNTISDSVETEFGYHLIFKRGEVIPKEYEIARIYLKTKTKTDIVPPREDWKFTGLSGKQLKRAEVTEDPQSGEIQVSLQFNDEGTKLFGDITTRNSGKQVAIFLDGELKSSPRVNEPILSGSAVISGGFGLAEAKDLAKSLNTGALPVPVELIGQQKVDATLGADSLHKSINAGLIGFLAVIIFMILYYRLPGILAVFALLLYTSLSLAIFKGIGVTLTLSGIAGFILSVGMAVDANVLIFERLKEELRGRRSLKMAMEESFVRAWPSIRDSNITTLISCAFLIWLGGGFVKGFATTLAIGVLVSMFTAIIITRSVMRLVAPLFKEEGNWMFWGYTKPAPSEEIKK